MKRRRPSTIGQFVLLGLLRGAVSGGLLGLSVGAFVAIVVWIADGVPMWITIFPGIGLLIGVPLGLAIGALIGAITGLFRYRFDPMWPVAAGTVFVLTLVSGSVIAVVNAFFIQDDVTKWGHAFVGVAWALGIGVGLALVAGLASVGIRGSQRG